MPNLNSTCDFVNNNGSQCPNPWYSWSKEHGDLAYCRAHYLQWLQQSRPRQWIQLIIANLDDKTVQDMVRELLVSSGPLSPGGKK